jgi:hypothetical protein
MICKGCKTKVDEQTIYCYTCGRPTENFRTQFSVSGIITRAKNMSANPTTNVGWLISLLVLCLIGLTVLSFLDFPVDYWTRYIVTNVIFIVFAPVLLSLLSLSNNPNSSIYELLKHYPRLLVFTFCCALYFLILKMICTAFSVMSYDPILNLVRFVMILWGIAIVYPVPMLIFTRDDSVIKLIYTAYIAGKYIRWQQFYLSVYSAIRIILAPIFPSNYLLVSKTMKIWDQQSEKFGLYEKSRDY